MIPFDADEYYKTRGTTDANPHGLGTKATANAFLAADSCEHRTDSDPQRIRDRIAEEVGDVDMLGASATTALNPPTPSPSCKNSTPAIIQIWYSTTVLTACPSWVLHGRHLVPNGDIWDSITSYADSGVQCEDGISLRRRSEWGHEYESETPRA